MSFSESDSLPPIHNESAGNSFAERSLPPMEHSKCITIHRNASRFSTIESIYCYLNILNDSRPLIFVRVSFIDAMRCLAAFVLGYGGVEQLITNPPRPGRSEPRVIRRRKKQFDMMNKSREAYRQAARQQEVGA